MKLPGDPPPFLGDCLGLNLLLDHSELLTHLPAEQDHPGKPDGTSGQARRQRDGQAADVPPRRSPDQCHVVQGGRVEGVARGLQVVLTTAGVGDQAGGRYANGCGGNDLRGEFPRGDNLHRDAIEIGHQPCSLGTILSREDRHLELNELRVAVGPKRAGVWTAWDDGLP